MSRIIGIDLGTTNSCVAIMEGSQAKILENIEIIEKDLITVFEKNNIKKINCLNEKFDPNNHQAMLEIEDEKVSPGTVIQEIQPGYFYKDRLLRPSFVAVAKKRDIKNNENEEK